MNEGTSRDHPVRSTFLAMEIIFAPGRSTWVAQIGIGKATFLTLVARREKGISSNLQKGRSLAWTFRAGDLCAYTGTS